MKIITKILAQYKYALYLYNIKITQKQNAMKTLIDYTNKANELNTKYPNLKAEVTETWDGKPQITVCNSDKAKTLTEMYPTFKFNF